MEITITLPDIFLSSLMRTKNKEELEEALLHNAVPFKHNGKFYKLHKVNLPVLSYIPYKRLKLIDQTILNIL